MTPVLEPIRDRQPLAGRPRALDPRAPPRSWPRPRPPTERAVLVLHDVTKTYPNGKTALARRRPRDPRGRLRLPRRPIRRRQVDADQAPDPRRDRDPWRRSSSTARTSRSCPAGTSPRSGARSGSSSRTSSCCPTKSGLGERRVRARGHRHAAPEDPAGRRPRAGARRPHRPARTRCPSQLSGGEQQRTAIARALVHDPRLIIADEPTGNLDPLISWEIIQLLLRINELGVTVLMATHNADVVTALRKRVVALEEGRVIRDEVGGDLPPGRLTDDRVRRLQPPSRLAGLLAERADEPRGHRDDGPDAPAAGRLLDPPDRPPVGPRLHRVEGRGRRRPQGQREAVRGRPDPRPAPRDAPGEVGRVHHARTPRSSSGASTSRSRARRT